MPSESSVRPEIDRRPFHVAGWRVDPSACRLARDGDEVHIEPKVMQVLVHLADRPGQVVSRRELEQVVWTDTVVGYEAVTNAVIKLRKALSDDARHPEIIETIPKRGYRLLAEVTTEHSTYTQQPSLNGRKTNLGADLLRNERLSADETMPSTKGRPLPTITLVALIAVLVGALAWWRPWAPQVELASQAPDNPSLAVLPFNPYSDDAEQFANGLTEDLTTTLSRIPGLFVVSRSSTSQYQNEEIDMREVAADQGVRHVLAGGVQTSGNDLRISAQLVDGITGQHVWAQKYDRPATDFFTIQDDIVKQIAVQMQVSFTEGDHARVVAGETRNLEAWLLRNQARAAGLAWTREGFVRARELYQAAHAADPSWGRPLAGLAWVHWGEAWMNFSESRAGSIEKGIEFAERAIALNPESPVGYMILGNLMALQGDWDQTIALRERAVELAPNDLPALVGLAGWLTWAGEEARALDVYRRAKQVSPIYPWWALRGNGLAFHLDGQHDAAIQLYRQSLERRPQWKPIHIRLAAVYADLGQYDEAKKEVEVYLDTNPTHTLEDVMVSMTFKEESGAEWYADLLRKAGMPE